MTSDDIARFWAKVDRRGPDECWEWTGARTSKGYGNYWTGKGNDTAHRISLSIHGTEIPPGMHVLHKCDNKPCVNPDHLYVGTQQDNNRDMAVRGRLAIPNLALTPADVREIRRVYRSGEKSQTQLAGEYGVCRSTVKEAISGVTWGYIDDVRGTNERS